MQTLSVIHKFTYAYLIQYNNTNKPSTNTSSTHYLFLIFSPHSIIPTPKCPTEFHTSLFVHISLNKSNSQERTQYNYLHIKIAILNIKMQIMKKYWSTFCSVTYLLKLIKNPCYLFSLTLFKEWQKSYFSWRDLPNVNKTLLFVSFIYFY